MSFENEFLLVPKQYVEWLREKQCDVILLMYELREYCIWAHIISFVTKLISWFYKIVWLVWLVFEKVLSDYFFFVDFFFCLFVFKES